MKNIKKIVTVILSLAMALGIIVIPATKAEAAAKATVTKSVHLYVGEIRDDAIDISFVEKEDHVGKIKTSSPNLKAKVVRMTNDDNGATAQIGLYAAVRGSYTVSFDVLDLAGDKVSSHSVKVYANSDRAIKSITFAGQKMHRLTDKLKGKLSVTMNKGFTLKKIVVETYDKEGKQKSKTVKNNSMIELGKYAYIYGGTGEVYDEYYYLNTSLRADTAIHIYYTDKYTKTEASETYFMYHVAE